MIYTIINISILILVLCSFNIFGQEDLRRYRNLPELRTVQREPVISITADNLSPHAGEPVKFTLAPDSLVMNKILSFTFDFGDGSVNTMEAGSNHIIHNFISPGIRKVSVSVSTNLRRSSKIDSIEINVRNARLEAEPLITDIDNEVRFITYFQAPLYQIRYRYFFGDGNDTDWSSKPETVYKYAGPGEYEVYSGIELELRGKKFYTESIRKTIQVRSPVTEAPSVEDIGSSGTGISVITDVAEPVRRDTAVTTRRNDTSTVTAPASVLSIRLLPDKQTASEGDTITFTVTTNAPDRLASFEYGFGDNSEGIITSERIIKHVYNGAGLYNPTVRLLINNNPADITAAAGIRIFAVETAAEEDTPLLLYILTGALILTLSYIMVRKQLVKVKPELKGFPDAGSAEVNSGNLAFNYSLILNRNPEGSAAVITVEDELILLKRSEDE